MAYVPRQVAQMAAAREQRLHSCTTFLCMSIKRATKPGAGRIMVSSSKLQQSSTQDSLEEFMGVLKGAFGAGASLTTNLQPETAQHTGTSTRNGFATSSRLANSRSRQEGRDNSSISKRTSRSEDTSARPTKGSSGRDSLATSSSPIRRVKKHKGPFVDLMTAIEKDMMQPAQSKHSSDSTVVSRSNGSSSSSSACLVGRGSSQVADDSTSTINHTTRRIRGKQLSQHAANQQSSQQSTQQHQRRHQHQHHQQQQSPSLQPHHHQQQQQPDPGWLHHPLVLGNSKKQYRPVYKGDLALPGGPAWSSLRRHIVAAGNNTDLPTLDCIVLLEGDQDQHAVARAVNAPVYVCDGTRAMKDHVKGELEMLKLLGRSLVVLTDPDERGRELRVHLDNIIGPLYHAFVPEQQGMSTLDGPVHTAGNRGIEHVVPEGVQHALTNKRQSYPADRTVWSMDLLIKMGLANAYDAGELAAGRGAAARRRRLCAVLGLGRCTGSQLVAMLNKFFSVGTVEAAMVVMNADQPTQQT